MAKHDHKVCDHKLKYCAKCDVVYCAKCDKEWKQNTWLYYTPSGGTSVYNTEDKYPWDVTVSICQHN